MVEQRVATTESEATPSDELWKPEDLPAGIEVQPSDAYVVVDELIDDVLVLASSPWPVLDQVGRLAPPSQGATATSTSAYPVAVLQNTINEHRRRLSDPADPDISEVSDRPLRIGDVFSIRGFAAGDPTAWEVVVDVTAQARTAAKIALYGAVAPITSKEEAEEQRRLTSRPGASEPPPPPSTAPGFSGAAPAV